MDLYGFLEAHAVPFERHDHAAVFTVEEAERLVPALPAAKTKSLFLRDGKGRVHVLVVVPSKKSTDLKALARALGVKGLGFGSPDRLRKHLGITPGSVSLLALVNDPDRTVSLVVDEAVWKADALQCHPLVNTSTLVVPREGVRRFLEATGHEALVIEVPERG